MGRAVHWRDVALIVEIQDSAPGSERVSKCDPGKTT